MKINFSKYNGAGNDFIIIDDRDNNVHLTKSDIYNLCNRNIGIGGDGLIIIKKSIKTDLQRRKFYCYQMILDYILV